MKFGAKCGVKYGTLNLTVASSIISFQVANDRDAQLGNVESVALMPIQLALSIISFDHTSAVMYTLYAKVPINNDSRQGKL